MPVRASHKKAHIKLGSGIVGPDPKRLVAYGRGELGLVQEKMAYRRTTYNCHDGQLEACRIGPRNELVLDIYLDPIWNPNGPKRCTIRFGAIRNMNEVKAFFSSIPKKPQRPGGFLDEVIGIVYAHKANWILDLADAGAIRVQSTKFSEI